MLRILIFPSALLILTCIMLIQSLITIVAFKKKTENKKNEESEYKL